MVSSYSSAYAVSTGVRDGAWNMAFDKALFELFKTGRFQKKFGCSSMLWRFYTWAPPAVSLGHSQRAEEIDEESCRRHDIDIVRRPTGGRAVLHIDEFTYSLLAETRLGNAEIYAMVHETIRGALSAFGIQTEFCRTTPDIRRRYNSTESASCFTASARNELQVKGRKLVGSAQHRSGNVILQHGSVVLSEKHKMLVELLCCRDEKVLADITDDLDRKTVSLHELIGCIPDHTTLVKAMIAAISQTLKTEVKILDERDISSLF